MAASTVSGRVVGPDANPVAGASVMFASGPVPLADIAQLTDAEGRFSLAAPVQGVYRILVNAGDAGTAEREVKVTGKASASLVIQLGSKR
jgi:hypothetical protein